MYDVLIIGGGVSGMSCALILGSAQNKTFVTDKKIGIIAHQKASSLQKLTCMLLIIDLLPTPAKESP